MSTYRVPKLNQLHKESEAQPETTVQAPTSSPNIVTVIVAGSALLVGIVVVVALLFRGGGPPAPQPVAGVGGVTTVVATTTVPTITPPTPTPDCVPATTYLTIITEQELQLKWDTAAENALAALNTQALCQQDRPILAQKYVTDSLEGLYARPDDHSKAGQQEVVDRYLTIKRQSQPFTQLFDVTFPQPLVVAQRAGQSGKFLLAIAAYDEAYKQGSLNTADQALVKDYISNLYNVGFWWTEQPNSPTYAEGLAYLSASYGLEQKYRTGQAEAWRRLTELVGQNSEEWPEPASSPLL